jgi:hypothetical protein
MSLAICPQVLLGNVSDISLSKMFIDVPIVGDIMLLIASIHLSLSIPKLGYLRQQGVTCHLRDAQPSFHDF